MPAAAKYSSEWKGLETLAGASAQQSVSWRPFVMMYKVLFLAEKETDLVGSQSTVAFKP